MRVDAADEQPLPLARLQEIERGAQARLPAGKHDDAVGGAHVGRLRQKADMLGENAKTDRQRDDKPRNAQQGEARTAPNRSQR